MNMKKSIAGVMAGAMAVSAMATSASAMRGYSDRTSIVLSYDLRLKKDAFSDGKLTVTYKTNENKNGYFVTATDAEGNKLGKTNKVYATIGAKITNANDVSKHMFYNLDLVKISGTSLGQTDENGKEFVANNTYSFSTNSVVGTAEENKEVIKLGDDANIKDGDGYVYGYKIPFVIGVDNVGYNMTSYEITQKGSDATTPQEYYTKADAEAAAKVDPVYTKVEEILAETSTKGWYTEDGTMYTQEQIDVMDFTKTGENTGVVTVVTSKEVLDTSKPKVLKQVIEYTKDDLVPAKDMIGNWVVALKHNGENAVYVKGALQGTLDETTLTDDVDKIVGTGQYATKALAEQAIEIYKGTLSTKTDWIIKPTKAVDLLIFETTGNGAQINVKVADDDGKQYYIKCAVPGGTLTAEGILDGVLAARANTNTKDNPQAIMSQHLTKNDIYYQFAQAGVDAITTDKSEAYIFDGTANFYNAANANELVDIEYPETTQNVVKFSYKYYEYPTKLETTTKVTPVTYKTSSTKGLYYLADKDGVRKLAKATPNTVIGYGFKQYTVTLEFTMNRQDWTWYNNETWLTQNMCSGIDGIGACNPIVTKVDSAKTEYYMPLETNWNKPGDVIQRLTDNKYTYPLAVLNDVVANNERVVFAFQTSKSYVDTREWVKAEKAYTTSDVVTDIKRITIKNPAGGLATFKVVGGNQKKANPAADGYLWKYAANNDGGYSYYIENPYYGVAYDSNNKDEFNRIDNAYWYHPYFTQDLYKKWTWSSLNYADYKGNDNGYYYYGPNGSEDALSVYGSYSGGWNKNLLAAGLVINARFTMQLNETVDMDWGDDTLFFEWDNLTSDDKKTAWNDVITSMQLITPQQWFWDSMSVEVGAAVSIDASAGAGLEEDAEEVVEDVEEIEEDVEDIEEDIEEDVEGFDDYDDTEDYDDYEEEDEEPEPEPEAPVAEESSPVTGNAPVALAVIPVALAAAAVIAKKKN